MKIREKTIENLLRSNSRKLLNKHIGRSSDFLSFNAFPFFNSGIIIETHNEITAAGTVSDFHGIPY